MYTERRSIVPGAVVWQRVATGDEVRVLPDGCMDLMWTDAGRLVIAGPDTAPQLYQGAAGSSLTAVRFAPGSMPLMLGVPAATLRDQRVPLEDVWPSADVARLADALQAARDPGLPLERFAAARLLDSSRELARLEAIVRALASGARVARVADLAGLSERQLHRRSLDAFGYGPKVLARILRMARAVDRVRAGVPLVDAAEGYADQAHLARDVRRLAGVPLRQLTR